jgi:hypothetical protein
VFKLGLISSLFVTPETFIVGGAAFGSATTKLTSRVTEELLSEFVALKVSVCIPAFAVPGDVAEKTCLLLAPGAKLQVCTVGEKEKPFVAELGVTE